MWALGTPGLQGWEETKEKVGKQRPMVPSLGIDLGGTGLPLTFTHSEPNFIPNLNYVPEVPTLCWAIGCPDLETKRFLGKGWMLTRLVG